MDALIVVDMQQGMFMSGRAPRDVDGVVERINAVARAMRKIGKPVIFVQHHGGESSDYAPDMPGFPFLETLDRFDADLVVGKTICDSFYKTKLNELLYERDVKRILICGWATDYCVDTTVRSAASHEYDVTVVGDGHTAADRSYLDAAKIIEHHNAVWADMGAPSGAIHVIDAKNVLEQLGAG